MRGGGGALTANYTTLAEDLASHGYIVVGFDVPYRSVIALAADGTAVARTPENNLDLVAGPQPNSAPPSCSAPGPQTSDFPLSTVSPSSTSTPPAGSGAASTSSTSASSDTPSAAPPPPVLP